MQNVKQRAVLDTIIISKDIKRAYPTCNRIHAQYKIHEFLINARISFKPIALISGYISIILCFGDTKNSMIGEGKTTITCIIR